MKSRKDSILFILDNLELGGIQRQLLEVCRALIRNGSRCVVACFRSHPDSMARRYQESGTEVVFLEKKPGLDLSFFFRLRKLIKDDAFDLIHAMTPQASFWIACALPYKSKTRFVGSLLNTYKFDKPLDRLCESFIAAPRMDAVFVNSRAGARYYRDRIPHPPPIWRIYNGVRIHPPGDRDAMRKNLGVDGDSLAIVCVGRLEQVKRHVDAISALSSILKKRENVSLYIIGGGALRESLESFASSLGVKDRVKFLGERDDTQEILSAFDIFLLPSRSEGFPNALLEAMAEGLPCVATRVGGIPEIIQNGKNGILVNPCSPKEISEALSDLIDSAEKRKYLGEAARSDMKKRFEIDRMIESTLSRYKTLLRPRRYDMAYLLSQFPKISEAFILREMAEMRKRGISFCVASLKPSSEKIAHKEAITLREDAFYLPWFGFHVILMNLTAFLRSPSLYLKTFGEYMYLHRQMPGQALKAFVTWFKTVGFASILRRNGVVHIHANWASIPTSCALAMSRLLSRSFSFTAHAFDIYHLPASLEKKIRDALFITTCTDKNKRHLSGLTHGEHDDKIHLVRHFISPPKGVETSPETPPVVLSIGSLDRYKGHDLLIRSCLVLWRKGLDFNLHIIGDGPEKPRLMFLISRAQAMKKVKLLGGMPQDRVFVEIGKATVFALASIKGKRSDNLPNAIIEASLLNVPCIMSNIGSIKEFIIPHETGLIFKPGNIMDLSDKLETLLNDAELRNRLARNARIKAHAMFSTEQNAPILENLFKEAIRKNLEKDEIHETI